MTTALLYVFLVCGKPDFFIGVHGSDHLESSAYRLTHEQKAFYAGILHDKNAKVLYLEWAKGICV